MQEFKIPTSDMIPKEFRFVVDRWGVAICRSVKDSQYIGFVLIDGDLFQTPCFESATELRNFLCSNDVHFVRIVIVHVGRYRKV